MQNFIIDKNQIEASHHKEWLVTNGIGGFACGTICGKLNRKYHSLLSAALPAPFGRTIMLNHAKDEILFSQQAFPLSLIRTKDCDEGNCFLIEFRIEDGIPFWKYEKDGIIVEKCMFLIHKQNTLCITYKLLSQQDKVTLKWRPFFHFRMHEQAVDVPIPNENYGVHAHDLKYEIECPNFPILRVDTESHSTFTTDSQELKKVFYEIEFSRGYNAVGNLSSPGYFTMELNPNVPTSFLVSTEDWQTMKAISASEAFGIEKLRKRNLLKISGAENKNSVRARLVLAADQFLMTPKTRFLDMVRLQAAGEEVQSIIAGFPWFTDWGRDTMISLEGLTLCTGRISDAHAILHTFSHYIYGGLIPNMFPDGETKGIYNTADASLWFFHAIDRYVERAGDTDILQLLLPKLNEIIQFHIKGTFFGIKMDTDGLLTQGQKNYQLTWMDAKVGDWVVTPRRGKAVEINALWYNALKLFEKWSGSSLPITKTCYESFNQKFWFEQGNYLYDVIDGEVKDKDSSLRPNQLFAISLSFPILKEEKWKYVLEIVEKELLTPVGLRTLAPSDPEFKPYYDGDLRARDAAYHQGTVWPWLIGPFIDVWLRVHPEKYDEAGQFLNGLKDHLDLNCMGTIGEIFDAEEPYLARGCFAQAWSVAEFLRCLDKVNQFKTNRPLKS